MKSNVWEEGETLVAEGGGWKKSFIQGIQAGIPLVIGFIPIAIAFGIIAKQAGVGIGNAVAMSMMVFAGASQFAAINMLTAGAGILEIILATLVINLRHFVMGLSLMNLLKSIPMGWKAGLSFGITDETFAVATFRGKEKKIDQYFLAGLMLVSYLSWVLGTLVGSLLSTLIPSEIGSGMSIALYAMFIGLLVPAARKTKTAIVVASVSMVLNTLLQTVLDASWSIVLATVLGGLAGVWLGRDSS